MKKQHLLAGLAAIALMAGTGLAAAEEGTSAKAPPATAKPMKPEGKQPALKAPQNRTSAQEGQRQEGRPQSAEEKVTTPSTKDKKGAQDMHQGKKQEMREGKKGTREENRAAEQERRQGGTAVEKNGERNGRATSAQRQEGKDGRTVLQGLQGNASGTNVKLTEEQRTTLRQTIINGSNSPRVTNVNFDVTVGTVIPRNSVRVVPVPETLVAIEPAWRGFLYFVYEDDVVIVSPGDMRIIAVLAV